MKIIEVPKQAQTLDASSTSEIEVVFCDVNSSLISPAILQLTRYTLMIAVEGNFEVRCNNTANEAQEGHAVMIRKNCMVEITPLPASQKDNRCILLFFDERSLRFALMPFEVSTRDSSLDFFMIPVNDKIKVFTESLLLYYGEKTNQSYPTQLLINKLRELLWIFFHSDARMDAENLFNIQLDH